MALDAGPFMRTRTRGSPSWPTARRKAGYVCADRSSWTRETTCRRGGPYVFCRLDRLTVDDASRWRTFPAFPLPQHRVKLIPDRRPRAVRLELPKDVVDCRAWWKAVSRQVAPGTARPQQIQDRIHRRAHVGLAGTTTRGGIGDQRSENLPLRFRHIARKKAVRSTVREAMLFGPHAIHPRLDRQT